MFYTLQDSQRCNITQSVCIFFSFFFNIYFRDEASTLAGLGRMAPKLLKYPIVPPTLPFSFYTLALLKKSLLEYKEMFKIFHSFLKALKNRRGGALSDATFSLRYRVSHET